jgi:hypothetical protein
MDAASRFPLAAASSGHAPPVFFAYSRQFPLSYFPLKVASYPIVQLFKPNDKKRFTTLLSHFFIQTLLREVLWQGDMVSRISTDWWLTRIGEVL